MKSVLRAAEVLKKGQTEVQTEKERKEEVQEMLRHTGTVRADGPAFRQPPRPRPPPPPPPPSQSKCQQTAAVPELAGRVEEKDDDPQRYVDLFSAMPSYSTVLLKGKELSRPDVLKAMLKHCTQERIKVAIKSTSRFSVTISKLAAVMYRVHDRKRRSAEMLLFLAGEARGGLVYCDSFGYYDERGLVAYALEHHPEEKTYINKQFPYPKPMIRFERPGELHGLSRIIFNGTNRLIKEVLEELVERTSSNINIVSLANCMGPGEVTTFCSEIVTCRDLYTFALELGGTGLDVLWGLASNMDNDEHVVSSNGKVYSRKDLLLRAALVGSRSTMASLVFSALADFNEDVQLLDGREMSAMQLVITAIEKLHPRASRPELYTKLCTLMEHEDIKSVTIHGVVLPYSDIMSRAQTQPQAAHPAVADLAD